MLVRILGSAAGGGLPQWNCGCPNCAAAQAGSPEIEPRTQSSVAVSADSRTWFLLNVSPDVRQQIVAFPALGASAGNRRGTAIAGCILTDAELDHTLGLLMLREGEAFNIYCTSAVRRCLDEDFPIARILAQYARHRWHAFAADSEQELVDADGRPSGLRFRSFELPGHFPRYAAHDRDNVNGSVVGLMVDDVRTGKRLVYAPGVAGPSESLDRAASEASCVLLDGTFWTDDELTCLGITERTAREMGHWPVGGTDGSLAWFGRAPAAHRIYVHINNTNPMLRRGSPERTLVENAGIRVGTDGDCLEL
jgi:pyrroloquinoline quinone biosynthesis protein B